MTETLLDGDQATKENVDYRAELFGPGKKFDKTKYPTTDEWEAAVARGKWEADQTVSFRNQRMDELKADYLRLKEDYDSRAKLEEVETRLMDQLTNRQLTSSDNTKAKEDVKQPAIDPNEIKSIFANEYQAQKRAEKESENFNQVRSKLKEKFGDNYPRVLQEQIDTLGLTKEFVDDLARKHPTVLFKTLGLDQEQTKETFQSPIQSNRRNDNFAPSAPKQRTWSYYQDLKRKDPKEYLNQKTQVQMQQDAINLGDAFKDGDYNH